MIDPVNERRLRLTGIALMCGACVCFTGLDTIAKLLSAHMGTAQVVWARYVVAFAFGLVVSNPITRPSLLHTRRPWLQLARSTLLVASTFLNFVALRYLQLDQTVSIIFATPFIITLLGGPLLGEWVGWRRWTAVLVGFSGVLLVTRPGAGGIHPAALLSFGAAICYALYNIATRVLSKSDSTETTLFYSNMVGAAVMSLGLPWFWTAPGEPGLVVLMIAMGLLGGFGHYLLIVAHRRAPAAVLAPFIYTQIVSMIAAGYLVFSDVPNAWTLAGAAVVVASGLYILYREQKVKGKVDGTAVVE